MKKYFLILLVLFSFGFRSNLQAEGEEIRHLWLHHHRFARNDEVRHEYFKRAEVLGVNAIFMFVDDIFDNRPDYFQAILDSATNRGMKLFIVPNWDMNYEFMIPNSDYLYRPLNMTKDQWISCINSADPKNRGFTSKIDKNNPNVKIFFINELLKYFYAYPEIAGIGWDHSRMNGLLGSYHEDAQQYIKNNSDIDIDKIRNEVYGKLPMPAFRNKSSIGMNATTCKVLAKYEIDKNIEFLGITYQEHDNSGNVVCFNRNAAAFEMPLYSDVAKTAILNTDYHGDTVYVKYTNSWIGRGAFEFVYSIEFNPIYVDSVDQVPDGAPYIIIDGTGIDGFAAKKLLYHANTGASIIIGQPPFYAINQEPVEEITKLMGFNRASYTSPYLFADSGNITNYMYITNEGREFGIPETDMDINEQIELAKQWMQWNANEMLGGTIRDMKIELKKRFPDRKLSFGVTRFDSDPWIQQQDWATWIEKGYIDFNTIMNYTNNTDQFNRLIEISKLYVDNEENYNDKVTHIIGMYYTKDQKENLANQANSSIEKYGLKGFGFFEDPSLIKDFTYDELINTGDNFIIKEPVFYMPEEIPVQFIFKERPVFRVNKSEVDFGMLKINEEDQITLEITNNNNTILDIVDIKGLEENILFFDETSFLVEPNQTKTISVIVRSEIPKKVNSQIEIISNATEETFLLPFKGEIRNEAPQLKIYPGDIEFTSTAVNDTASMDIVIKNKGMKPLIVDKVNLDNQNVNLWYDFVPGEITGNDSLIVKLYYSPINKGVFDKTMTIFSNDPVNDSLAIKIAGEGKIPPKLQIFTGEQ